MSSIRRGEQITLWTHTVVAAARRIDARNGFERTTTQVHHEFGEPVQGETWRVMLMADPEVTSGKLTAAGSTDISPD